MTDAEEVYARLTCDQREVLGEWQDLDIAERLYYTEVCSEWALDPYGYGDPETDVRLLAEAVVLDWDNEGFPMPTEDRSPDAIERARSTARLLRDMCKVPNVGEHLSPRDVLSKALLARRQRRVRRDTLDRTRAIFEAQREARVTSPLVGRVLGELYDAGFRAGVAANLQPQLAASLDLEQVKGRERKQAEVVDLYDDAGSRGVQ